MTKYFLNKNFERKFKFVKRKVFWLFKCMVKCNKETGITFKVGMQQWYVLLKNYDKADKQLGSLLQRYYGKVVKFNI